MRAYLITKKWEYKSVLLGTRKFNPPYGDRESTIRLPLRRWIRRLLSDFGLCEEDLYGCTSDGGSDLKWMTSRGMALKWQWCVPHRIHAASKAAFGISGTANKAMAALTQRITATVLKFQKVEKMGDLFKALVVMSNNSTKCKQLVIFR